MPTSSEQRRANYETFRECLSEPVIRKLAIRSSATKPGRRKAAKGRKKAIKPVAPSPSTSDAAGESNDAEELCEFVDYLAAEIFDSFPEPLQTLTHTSMQSDAALHAAYSDPLPQSTLDSLVVNLPVSVTDSLVAYSLIPDSTLNTLSTFLAPVFTTYTSTVTAPPPVWSATRASACEICGRDWIPLTYHHLIPRSVHDRVLKRGWHEEWVLNSVAWLCRACHSFVHSIASNEELARDWYTVERLTEREDVQRWAAWVGRIRWKAR